MDSQDSEKLGQRKTMGNEHIMSGDTSNWQYVLNSSQPHSQSTAMNSGQFIHSDQFPNHFTTLNHQYPRTFAINPMSAQISTQSQKHSGPGFSFQGLLNDVDIPTANPISKVDRQPTKKAKVKITQTASSVPLRRWSIEEDVALTKAWLYISVDADVGNNQKSGSLWNRILQVWRSNMGEYDPTRNSNALGCRWGTIQTAVSKFHGFYEQLQRNPPSGTTPDDMRREALRMYSIITEGTFKFEHCWDILKKNVKWCTQQLTKQGASKKQKLGEDNSVDRSHEVGVDETDPATMTTENTTSDGVVRPGGRKAAKEKKKQVVAEKGVIDVLGQLHCAVEKQFEFNREELELRKERDRKEYELREQTIKEELEMKKARDGKELELKERNQKLKEKAQKRKDQERILNKDLSSMQPSLRNSFEELQKKILKEWEEDVLSGEAL